MKKTIKGKKKTAAKGKRKVAKRAYKRRAV